MEKKIEMRELYIIMILESNWVYETLYYLKNKQFRTIFEIISPRLGAWIE